MCARTHSPLHCTYCWPTCLRRSYAVALHERALLHLDKGNYAEATAALEIVLRVDRAFPALDAWLAYSEAHVARRQLAKEAADAAAQRAAAEHERVASLVREETEHCVAWRQTGGCDSNALRESAFDASCSAGIPPGASGYCECQRDTALLLRGVGGMRAAASDCGHKPLRCADACRAAWALAVANATALDASAVAAILARADADAEQRAAARATGNLAQHREARKAAPLASFDYYVTLSARCDMDAEDEEVKKELKKAYKKASLFSHPDRAGGSDEAFQAVAAAYETISDAAKRSAWRLGQDLPRAERRDGTLEPEHAERVARKYFPERFPFEPFGDPHQDRKDRAERAQRRLTQRQEHEQQQAERARQQEEL